MTEVSEQQAPPKADLSARFDSVRLRIARRLGLVPVICPEHAEFLEFRDAHQDESMSQVGQDLFVLHTLGNRRDGYFVEFGATNGVSLSNTCLLERSYGWQGICAEPSRRWHPELKKNRRCAIDTRCVWSRTGDHLRFAESGDAVYSTLKAFADSDSHAELRRGAVEYDVTTVSLVDLLASHGAPAEIDYLSIDTEGSELEILAAHDFDRYRFRVITVEHNFVQGQRRQIQRLLSSRGYRRCLPALSRWDDWYVLKAAR